MCRWEELRCAVPVAGEDDDTMNCPLSKPAEEKYQKGKRKVERVQHGWRFSLDLIFESRKEDKGGGCGRIYHQVPAPLFSVGTINFRY